MSWGLLLGLLVAIASLATGGPPARAEGADLTTAHAALARGAIAEAITLYTELLQQGSLSGQPLAIAYRERGIAQQKAGFARHAIADYTNALWLDVLPSQLKAETYLGRAVAYLELGQLDRADQDFVQAINNDPGSAEAQFGRGTVRRLQGRPREALAHFDRALKLGHPRPAFVHFSRGLTFEALGTHDAALEAYKQAAALAPGLEMVREKLADFGQPLPIAADEGAAKVQISTTAVEVADAGSIVFASQDDSGPTGAVDTVGEGKRTIAADNHASRGDTAPTPTETPAKPNGNGPPKPPTLRPGSDGPLGLGRGTQPPPPQPATSQGPGGGRALGNAGEQMESADEATLRGDNGVVQVANVGIALPTASSQYLLQLAAYNSKDSADSGLASVSMRYGELLGLAPLFIESAMIPDKGTIYRLRAGPFESEEAAQATCRKLAAQGQDCLLVPQAQTTQN